MESIDTYFLFGEYQKNKIVTPVHADNINQYETINGIDPYLRFADPAAAQQIADLSEYDLYFNLSSKNLRESINCVNTLFFQDSKLTGRKRLLVHDSCDELIRQLCYISWKEDAASMARESSSGSVKPFMPDDNKTDWDLIDALRYGLFSYIKAGNVDLSVLDHTKILEGSADEAEDMADDSIKFYKGMADQGMFRVSSNIDDWD
jgi:hypothetical protein